MDRTLRELEKRYHTYPTRHNFYALFRARQRAGLPDLLYRVYIDVPEHRQLIANWNREQQIKMDHDLYHYPMEEENNAVIIWPGFIGEEFDFEQLLSELGIRWEYEPTRPYPEEGYDYTLPPPGLAFPDPDPDPWLDGW